MHRYKNVFVVVAPEAAPFSITATKTRVEVLDKYI